MHNIYFKISIFSLFRLTLLLFINFYIILACSLDARVNYEINDEMYYSINRDVLQEYKGFIQIPGVGMQRFFEFDYTVTDYDFHYGSLYKRWRWSELEPTKGTYEFQMMDDLLEECRSKNMALCMRIGSLASAGWGSEQSVPMWLYDKEGVVMLQGEYKGQDYYTVDLDHPTVWYHFEKLIRAFGERYNGHPDLALMDIGSVGLWGEWHNYVDRDFLPSVETCEKVIDLYFEVFSDTPLTIAANARGYIYDEANWLKHDFFPYIIEKGPCGWRGDAWGDGPGNSTWNHHEAYYRPMHDENPDLWKTGTVALEPSYNLGDHTTPPNEVINDAIEWHVTLIHNKYASIPSEWMPEIERLMKVIGFRLVLRDLSFDNFVLPAGKELTVVMDWENIGIAPPYRDHRIAFRLRDKDDKQHAVTITSQSIQGWLPGKKNIAVKYRIPHDLPAGGYSLEMGLVFHSSIDHNIPIANKGKTLDGWYILGDVNIL